MKFKISLVSDVPAILEGQDGEGYVQQYDLATLLNDSINALGKNQVASIYGPLKGSGLALYSSHAFDAKFLNVSGNLGYVFVLDAEGNATPPSEIARAYEAGPLHEVGARLMTNLQFDLPLSNLLTSNHVLGFNFQVANVALGW
jgi:hypothetical protein